MVFTKLFLENAFAIRPCNCKAASELFLPKVAHCIPVLPSRYIGKCTARVLKHSGRTGMQRATLGKSGSEAASQLQGRIAKAFSSNSLVNTMDMMKAAIQ